MSSQLNNDLKDVQFYCYSQDMQNKSCSEQCSDCKSDALSIKFRVELRKRESNPEKAGLVTQHLMSNGFLKYEGEDKDYTCVKRLHYLHYLFWSENLKHFSIGMFNETGKRGAGGTYNKWNMIMIPKPIYTVEQAQLFLNAIT